MKQFVEMVYQYPLSHPLPATEDYFLLPVQIAQEIGMDAQIFTLGDKEEPSSLSQPFTGANGIRIKRFDSILGMLLALRRTTPALTHGHTFGWIPSTFAPLVTSPYVLTAHIYKISIYNQFKVKVACSLLSRSEAIIVSTESSKKDASRYLDPDLIRVIPHPVDTKFFGSKPDKDRDTIRREIGVRSDERVILCVANLVPVKNIETLIRAMGLLRQERKDLRLVVIGGAPDKVLSMAKAKDFGSSYQDFLVSLAKESGLDGKMTFTGYLNHTRIREVMSIADALCLPSHREAQSLTAGEAAAAGVPLILSDVEPLREIFGKCALFHTPTDHKRLADSIRQVLEDAGLRKKLTDCGRVLASNYDIEVIKPRLKDLYLELLA